MDQKRDISDFKEFILDLCPPPPPHMPLVFGPPPPRAPPPRSQAGPSDDMGFEPQQDVEVRCTLCARALQDEESPLCCPHPGCSLRAHVICLAEEFLQEEPGQLLPLEGACPGCKNSLLWGDLIWLCRMGTEEDEEDSELEEEHWTDMLKTRFPAFSTSTHSFSLPPFVVLASFYLNTIKSLSSG
ncbi:structure-specific endonuclease subunit SLX1-like [Bos javanicus]|uniref:structure-specific endonuclease subunit SLX1-like n=1 Tax=Bos javanicus TaxID=9906 RepID=UPI002AA8C426|nr:structure-specific endonuclease subunit SLX1-like [Bos javanicus]